MLGLMLQAHPRMAIPPENRFVLPTYLHRDEYSDLRLSEDRRKLADKIVRTKGGKFKDFGLDADEITERIVEECSTVGSALGLVLRAYADRFGKVRWGDKRPGYHGYVEVIQRLFPDAQFINIVRDGRDVAASLQWVPPLNEAGPYRRIQAWREALDNTRAAREWLRPDTYYELQYEHLVTAPEKELRGLCDFLGEPFDEAMLNPQDVSHQVVPERKTWHANTRNKVSSSSIGKFKEQLQPWEIGLCEAVFGDLLEEYGYELTGAPAPEEEHLEEYRRTEAKRLGKLRKEKEKDRALWDARPVADMPPSSEHDQVRQRLAAAEKERDQLKKRLDDLNDASGRSWTRSARNTLGKISRGRT